MRGFKSIFNFGKATTPTLHCLYVLANFSLFLSAITQCFQSKFSIPSHGITEPVILYILSYLALLVLYTPKSGAMKYAHIFILSTFFTQIITYKMVELNVIKLHEMVKLLK